MASFNSNLGTGFNNEVYFGESQSDDKLIVGGSFTSLNSNTRNRLVRLEPDGIEDSSFYSNLGSGFNNPIYFCTIMSDDSILLNGAFTSLNGTTRNRFIKLNSNGTVDTTFYGNLGTGFGGTNTLETAIQTDGKMIIVGNFTSLNGNTRNYLVRLNSTGTEDTAFYTNLSTGFGSETRAIAIQTDGKILVGGGFITFKGNTRNRLVRLNSTGTEDTAFYTNLSTGFNNSVEFVKLQTDGKILVGGAFTTFKGNTRNRLVRLNSDGTEDTTFYTNLGSGFGSSVNVIELQSDGKILVGGAFTTLNGTTRNRFVRLNSTGTVDTAFYTNLGSGFGESVWGIDIMPNLDKIIVSGIYTLFDDNSRLRIVKLDLSGVEDNPTGFFLNGVELLTTVVSEVNSITLSGISTINSATIPLGDTEAPSAPGANSATDLCQNGFTLSWGAATDNVGVTGYKIYKSADNILWDQVYILGNVLTYGVNSQPTGQFYYWAVSALDAAGNEGLRNTGLRVKQTAVTLYGILGSEGGYSTAQNACDFGPTFLTSYYITGGNSIPDNGETIYVDSCGTTKLVGNGVNYFYMGGRSCIVSAAGVMSSVAICSI